jgi:hypothetical protein
LSSQSAQFNRPPTDTSNIHSPNLSSENPPRFTFENSQTRQSSGTSRDQDGFADDRRDSDTSFYSSTKFEDFNLKSSLLRGNFTKHLLVIQYFHISQVFLIWVFDLQVKFKPMLYLIY